jgi:DNA end-binding protein Ku
MPQAVWTGAIAFGLVNVPVKLYPATEPKDVRFHLYDRGSGKRVRSELVTWPEEPPSFVESDTRDATSGERASEPNVNAVSGDREDRGATGSEGARVEAEDIVKGYEDREGRIVALTPQEIAAITPSRSASIDVEDFVDLAQVDPVFFEKSYYVAPIRGVGAEKPYVLLLRAMDAAGKVGIGRFVLRTKPHLVAIRPMGRVLALETLFFGDEVRDPEQLAPNPADVRVSERELKIARELISTMAVPWDPSKYSDTYREELLALIRRKEPAEEPVPAEQVSSPGVGDLMEALRKSVEAAKGKRPTPRGRQSRNAV